MSTVPRGQAWDEAYRMVVREGATYAEAASATGIPLSTLQKRAGEEKWQGQRTTTMSYSAQVHLAKDKALQRFLKELDNEKATADDLVKVGSIWRGIEAAYPEHRYSPTEVDPAEKLRIAMEVLEEVWHYFAETDTNLLASLRGHAQALASRLEARYAPET